MKERKNLGDPDFHRVAIMDQDLCLLAWRSTIRIFTQVDLMWAPQIDVRAADIEVASAPSDPALGS